MQEGVGPEGYRRKWWSFTSRTADSLLWLAGVLFDDGVIRFLEQGMPALPRTTY